MKQLSSRVVKIIPLWPGRITLLTLLLVVGYLSSGCPADDESRANTVTPAVGCSVCPANTACQSVDGESEVVLCIPGGKKPDSAQDVADSSTADVSAQDMTGDMAAPDANSCNDFGCPCTQSANCLTGICLPNQFGGQCTFSCQTQCPEPWYCAEILISGQIKRVCVPQDFVP